MKSKKILALVLAFTLLLSLVPAAFGVAVVDIDISDYDSSGKVISDYRYNRCTTR